MANQSNAWTATMILSLLTLTQPASMLAGQPEEISDQVNGQTTDEVTFELRDAHLIVVKGSLAGLERKVNLVIDTGATATLVNRDVAKRAGLRVLPDMGAKLSAFGSGMKVERVLVRELQLGHRLITRSCLAADLPRDNIDIVVGVDILRASSLTIDYANSKLVFGGPSVGEASVALENEEDLLVVPVTMNGQTIQLAVDSGAHLTAVYRKAVAGWDKRVIGEKRVKVSHSGGSVEAREITLSSLEIGGKGITRPTVAILETQNPKSEIDGFLGTASLGVARIHFDFQRRVLSVE